jgi:polynucleotide 5'-kinase involved in rRNA processing
VVAVLGSKGAGKSTFARLLVNTLLRLVAFLKFMSCCLSQQDILAGDVVEHPAFAL